MLPLKRKCRVCGADMEYLSYASRAADTLFIRYKCPDCGTEAKEVAMLTLMQDNKKILADLNEKAMEERDLPWPDP